MRGVNKPEMSKVEHAHHSSHARHEDNDPFVHAFFVRWFYAEHDAVRCGKCPSRLALCSDLTLRYTSRKEEGKFPHPVQLLNYLRKKART